MRIIRTVTVGLATTALGLGAFAAAPVQAEAGQAQSERALPKRTLDEVAPGGNQINYNTFLLKGLISEIQADGITYLPYAKGKVQLQRKVCVKKGRKKGCNFKTIGKFKTKDDGKYRVKIKALESGRTKYRIKVKGSNGYGTTKGTAWTVGFK